MTTDPERNVYVPSTSDPDVNVWIANADLEVARVIRVLVELAHKTGRDWENEYDQAVLLPLAVDIALAVTRRMGADRGV